MPLYRAELLAKKPLRYATLIHDVSQVLYLPFDYDDGSYARDRSGYNNHGTIYGAARVDGKIGMALRFDGVDDRVEIPHSASLHFLNASEISFAYWAKPSAVGGTRTMGKGDVLTGRWVWQRFGGGVHVDGAWREFDSPDTSPLNKWAYVATTYSEFTRTVKVYVNAIEKVSETLSGLTTYKITGGTGILSVGSWVGPGYEFPGVMDSPVVYNRTLSQDEIRMLMYRRW